MVASRHRGLCTGAIRLRTECEVHYSSKNMLLLTAIFALLVLICNIVYLNRKLSGEAVIVDEEFTNSRFLGYEDEKIMQNLDKALERLSKTRNQSEHAQNIVSMNNSVTIAIGCAISTHNLNIDLSGRVNVTDLLENMSFFIHLMRGFCLTASDNYRYYFYIAYDYNDPLFSRNDSLILFGEAFQITTRNLACQGKSLHLKPVLCMHSKSPGWAQNDAMMAAYLDNMDYYYRINDDTLMINDRWTEKYIQKLSEFDPPNVGVVGPSLFCKYSSCDKSILTYDFVHRTHVEMFGFYYPRQFPEWYADRWITLVYDGVGRMKVLKDLYLAHTQRDGIRYSVNENRRAHLPHLLAEGQDVILTWINAQPDKIPVIDKPRKVIAYSLFGEKIRYWHGALRNAQLLRIFFPTWMMRIYLEPQFNRDNKLIQKYLDLIKKQTNVQVIEVSGHVASSVAPALWRFLVADDTDLEAFIVRDLDSRLSKRDKILVEEWLTSGLPFHIIRDHPKHSQSVRGCLIGAKPKLLLGLLGQNWLELGKQYSQPRRFKSSGNFIDEVVLPKVQNVALCHDIITCPMLKSTYTCHLKNITIPRGSNFDHVGQKFNEFEEPRQIDIDILRHQNSAVTCTQGLV
ncbi:uncharacterized protein LOC106175532 [Lingula anatina]|uniref:Uncharacterized protein LOC106175532 n=1 Tax=Lingula anatina TaxID=7574 RepID=A0A1S3JSG6_LINAN|nr:uncharacterized protein LOC106175532 [Lingula anatina]|eukprot:XP_013413046.1 uncharacterized protein LOC106175532 [Lingula anatina]